MLLSIEAHAGQLEKEVKEKTTQLVQSEKMAAVGQLAAGVAHEINNPLGVILGFSQSVVKRIRPGDPLEQPLKSIEREAMRCKELVQDLLTFSRMDKLEKERIDFNEVLESSLALVIDQAGAQNVSLKKQWSPDIPKIFGNRTQIRQVLVNLYHNALDAMPKGGTLTTRTQKTSFKGKEAIQFQVEDTGHGIPKEALSKIFEPFFTTKEVGKGMGLGLSLVYEIIQKHEGQITVNSEMNKGTTFSVVLPV